MKSNIVKYIFIIFVIGIIIFAIYKINFQKEEVIQENSTNTIQETKQSESILNIGISDYDNINPLITNNQDIISLSTILYEPLLGITNDYEIELKLAQEYSKVDATTYLLKLKLYLQQ